MAFTRFHEGIEEISLAISNVGRVDAEPLVKAIEKLPDSIGTNVEEALQPVTGLLKGLTENFIDVRALIQAIHSQVVPTQKLCDDVDEGCIQDAFEFMRALNQIDDLVADKKFTEPKSRKDNSTKLQGYKKTTIYTGCISILERRCLDRLLTEDEKAVFEGEFESLFESIEDDFQVRAQRLLDVQTFRRKVLDFFLSGRCQHEQPEESNIEPVVNIS